jgi:uncharacterized protein YndB with AHSA1/START domain
MPEPADAVRATVSVPAPRDRAFAVFTDGLGTWWPPEFTWSQDVLDTIGIEPRAGGLCFEIGPHGFRIDWGRVLTWEPPERLAFSWQIGPQRVPEPNPEKASEVEVRFVDDGPWGTRVELRHSRFDRHGEGGDDYRAAMAEQGWPYLLERYAGAVSR